MMETFSLLPLEPVQWAWGVVLFWLALGFAALLLQRAPQLLSRLVFPLGALGALFIAGVFVGADSMSRGLGVSSYLADLVVAMSLLSVLIGGFVTRFRIRFAAAPHAAREGG